MKYKTVLFDFDGTLMGYEQGYPVLREAHH